MNVGSILNGDLPPEEIAQRDSKPETDESRGPRHSINDLLNAPSRAKGSENQEAENPEFQRPSELSRVLSLEEAILRETETEFLEPKPSAGAPKSTETAKKVEAPDNSPESRQKEAKPEKYKPPHSRKLQTQTKSPSSGRTKQTLVDSDLAKIHRLKQQPGKPHRYPEPPIWAQEWIPASQQRDVPASAAPVPSRGGFSNKPVFNREHMYSSDLECSITGVIPAPSVVRTVAEWIYANFTKISLENRPLVELEIKFGTIIDQASGQRLDIGVSTECVYTKSGATRFEMGVHEVGWNEMKRYIEELDKQYQDELRRNPNPQKPRKKFGTLESFNTDFFFNLRERNEAPKKVRISQDNLLKPKRYVGIEKKKLSDLYIHNPSQMFDLRFSMSMEVPLPEGSIEPTLKKSKPILTREKRRLSYTHAPTATRFDFTAVSVPRTTKNKTGKAIVEHDNSHELELEIETHEIFRGYDKVRDGSDTVRFEELVEVFLNNARVLNTRVTKFALT